MKVTCHVTLELKCFGKFPTGFRKMECDEQVAVQKEKLEELSNNFSEELGFLVLVSRNFVQVGRREKSIKEKILVAVACWRTVREVCLHVDPDLKKGTGEEKRALKRTSMLLMRYSQDHDRGSNLVERRPSKEGFEYHLNVRGLKELFFRMEQAVRVERKRVICEQIEKCVKLNEEIVSVIEKIHACNSEILKKVENAATVEFVYKIYSNASRGLAFQMTKLQRSMVASDDDSRIDALTESTKALLQLGDVEVYMYGELRAILDEQKQRKDQIQEAELKQAQLREKQLENDLSQTFERIEKKILNAGLPVRLVKDAAIAREFDPEEFLEYWFSEKTDAHGEFGKTVLNVLVTVALYAPSSNGRIIVERAETEAEARDPQKAKKAQILLESLPFPTKQGLR